MADHLELVAEIPKVEKLTVQDRLELAKKRRSQQLKRWEREEDKELGPPPPKKRPQRAKPVKFEPRIILLEAASRGDYDEGSYDSQPIWLFAVKFFTSMIVMSWDFLFIGEFWIIDVSYPVKKMLDYGVDPNLANDDGLTSLHQVSRVSVQDWFTNLSMQS